MGLLGKGLSSCDVDCVRKSSRGSGSYGVRHPFSEPQALAAPGMSFYIISRDAAPGERLVRLGFLALGLNEQFRA